MNIQTKEIGKETIFIIEWILINDIPNDGNIIEQKILNLKLMNQNLQK